MLRPLVRFLFDHRARAQQILRALVPQPVLIALPDFKLYVRLDDWAVGARIAVKRSYETHVTQTMGALLQPDMVMVDIGANIGYYSLLAARRVGPAGKVLAFEPAARNVELLTRSAAANGFRNIHIHQLAVADQDGEVRFSMDDSNGVIQRDPSGGSGERVRAVALDTFLATEPRLDLVKIDVEGAEGLVLQGMRALLRRHRPILFTEFTPGALLVTSGVTGEAYLELLRELGYQVQILAGGDGRPATAQSAAEILRAFGDAHNDHVDLLAQPV